MKIRLAPLVLFLSLLIGSLTSRHANAIAADDDGQVDATTEELIQQGIASRRAGKDDAALAIFLQAEERAPSSVRVLLHIATAAQGTGKWLMAYSYLQRASQYRTHPYYQKYHAAIRQVEDAVAQHVGQFRAQGTPSGAEVLLNGEVVGKLPMDRSVAIERGSYELEVRQPGYFPLRRPISVAGGGGLSTEAVALNPMDHYPSGSVTANGPSTAASPMTMSSRLGDAPPARRTTWVTWTLAAGSAVLLGTSAVSFAIRERDAAKWNNDNTCLDGTRPDLTRETLCGNLRQEATTAERIGVISGALGVGLAAAAIAHWLVPTRRDESQSHHASHDALCSANLVGITCRATF